MLAPTQSKTDTIAITRTLDGVEAAVHRVIEQVGGMQSVLRRAKIATQTEFCGGAQRAYSLNYELCTA